MTVLDVGHTAAAPGAVSARGAYEYELNINLARRINEELLRAGFRSTYLMVTSGGLLQRPTRANNMSADLFLSIHHDSIPDEYLRSWQYEGEEHWFSDDFSGFAIFVSGKNGDYQRSLIFAKALADHLISSGLEPRTGPAENRPTTGRQFIALDRARGIFRFDDFAVLRESEMPAVIFEAGMIVNRDEEARLASPSGRARIAKAVTEAVREFCLAGKTASYQVIYVASDDVLYVRSGPSANLPSVGTIPPNGRGVRIVGACKGNWCPI